MLYIVQSVSLACAGLVSTIVGIFVNRKLYKNVKKEDHKERGKFIQRIMTTYAFVQGLGWPLLMFLFEILYLNKNLKLVDPFVTGYIIIATRFLYVWFRVYVGFNSFIVAICRYTFIVKDDFVCRIGFERIRNIFLTSSVAIPAVLALSNDATLPVELSWICMFMPRLNDTEAIENSSDIFCAKDVMADVTESPLFNILHDHLSPSTTFILQIFHKFVLIMATSNILEGILYVHTFVFITR